MQRAQQSLLGDSNILAALQANIAAAQNAVCEIAVGLHMPALTSWKFPHRLALSLPIGQLLTSLRYDPTSMERSILIIYLESKNAVHAAKPEATFMATSPIEICSYLVKILRSSTSVDPNPERNHTNKDQLIEIDMHTNKNEESEACEQSLEPWEKSTNTALDKETQTISESTERITEAREVIEFFSIGREYALCSAGFSEMRKLPFVKLRRALDCDVKRLLQSLANFSDEHTRTESRLQTTLRELEETQSTLAASEETFRESETSLNKKINDLNRQMEETVKRASVSEQNCLDLAEKLRDSEARYKTAEAELNSAKRSLDRIVAFVFNPSKEAPADETESKVVNAILQYQLNSEKIRDLEVLQREKLDRERQSATFLEKQNKLASRICELQAKKEELEARNEETVEECEQLRSSMNTLEDRVASLLLENQNLQTESRELRSAASNSKEDHRGCNEKLAELEHKLQLLVEFPDLNPSPEKPENLSDKGGSIAILNKADYKAKMLSLLEDRPTYKPLSADPTKAPTSSIAKVLKHLTGKKQLPGDITKFLKQTEPTIVRIYGLPKVHKAEVPLRPIVSLIGAPNYKISKWLFHQLHPLTRNCETSIAKSTEFLKRLRGITVSADEIMVSFDIVSLFTPIPLALAKQYTEDLLKSYDTDVPATALLELIDLCMETNFSFDQQYYQQLKGALMGSPISGFLAEITMQNLEATALPLVNPKLWLRYVDGTFAIVKKDQLETLHNTINSTMSGIKFTLEKEVDKELPFLDVLVKRKTDGTLSTSVYRKETYAEVILHNESNHPISHKRGTINSLLSRAKTHCSDEEGYRAG
ncbi:hypothetical protein SprV_0100053500 [Sparganum proliferum]